MAYQLRPVSDDKNEWSLTGGVNAWSVVDDAANNPTAPDTADFANTGTVSKILRCNLATQPALAPGEHVISATAHVYAGVPASSQLNFGAFHSTGGLATLTAFDGAFIDWKSVPLTSIADDMSGFKLQAISASVGGGGMTVFAMYLHIETTTPALGQRNATPMRLG